MLSITLIDGKKIEVEKGPKVIDVAGKLSTSLKKKHLELN